MKFGKVILQQGRELPDKQFLGYKQLKKMLKEIKAPISCDDNCQDAEDLGISESDQAADTFQGEKEPNSAPSSNGRPGILSTQEIKFIKALNEELATLNSIFMDEEESIVMRLQHLESELNEAQDCENNDEEISKLAKAFTDFHGEIVMLLHWGHVNYVAVTKILKKHDKQTGLPLHSPCIETILRQPFFSTELLQRLAKRVGVIVDSLTSDAPSLGNSASSDDDNDKEAVEEAGANATKPREMLRTHMALGMWRELRVNASTPSTLVHVVGDHLPETLQAKEEPAASTGPRVAVVVDDNDSDDSESCRLPTREGRKRVRAVDEAPCKDTRRRRVC